MKTSDSKHRVFLVDDHPLVREWLMNLINQQKDLMVCGEAEDVPSAMLGISNARPDVVVVDISLKEGSGLELIKRLKEEISQKISVLVFSMHDELVYAERALRAGASGYLTKRENTAQILEAIREIVKGKIFMTETCAKIIAGKIVGRHPVKKGSLVEQLSDRELEVFELLGRGFETAHIAETMHISIKTVQAFCGRIKEKLGLKNINELLREAVLWHSTGRDK